MRRLNSLLIMKDNYKLGLIMDCVYYCWQHEQISDEELPELEREILCQYKKRPIISKN